MKKTTKIRETRLAGEGLGGPGRQTRVRKLAEDEEVPAGAEAVEAETEEHDWREE